METHQLDDRSRTILLQTISDYISTAEPIGSRALSKNLLEKLSPATIRNVMADLEDMGYLQQPHTSAGRVPTDWGYKFFVNQILQQHSQNAPGIYIGRKNYTLDDMDQTLNGVLEKTCNLLSENSKQTSLVMSPIFSNMLLKQANFIKVGKNEALAVFITEMGALENKMIRVDNDCTQEQLASISNYLNQEFSGKSLRTIREEIMHRMRNEKEHYDQLMKKASELWTRVFPDEEEVCELYVNGLVNFLDQPEFTIDLDKMKSLLKTVEEKSKLIHLLDQCMHQDGMTILIGDEYFSDEMQGCSLIAKNYLMGNEKVGTVAIFGPKRMDYKRMIPIVNITANTVSELLSERKRRGALQSS